MNQKKLSPKYAGFLIIFFAVIGFTAIRIVTPEDSWICKNGEWVKHGNPSQTMPTKSCPFSNTAKNTDSESDVIIITKDFYDWYLQYNGNPLSSGAYKSNTVLTNEFKNRIETILTGFSQGGYDPILCAQDKPESFIIDSVNVNNGSATIKFNGKYGSNKNTVKLDLIKSDNQWQINNSTCVEPSVKDTDMVSSAIIYFNNDIKAGGNSDCGLVYGVDRSINSSVGDHYKAALEQLFKGPSDSEKNQGYTSMFSSATKSILKNLRIEDDTAYVNLTDIRSLIPNVSSSCGSQSFLSQIEETLKQDRKIEKVYFAINDNPQVFYEWIQVGCDKKINNCDKKPFMSQ